MNALDAKANEDLCERLMLELRRRFPANPAADPELRQTIREWMNDARIWGFNTDAAVTDYVVLCARQIGTREPLEARLEVYLQLHQERLVEGVDLRQFCPAMVTFARAHNILADEGVAWLASIILAGLAKNDRQLNWIAGILDDKDPDHANVAEETRLYAVHDQAVLRGWVL